MASKRGYKIRGSKAGTKERPQMAYTVTVPAELAENIKNRDNKLFEWEATEAGLLLKPFVEPEPEAMDLPDWMRS
jgi:hypothetical protein